MLVNWEIPDGGELTLIAPSNILLKDVFLTETQINKPINSGNEMRESKPENT